MKNLQFIFLRLSVYLIAGILLAFYIDVEPQQVFVGFGIALILFIIAFLRSRRILFPDAFFGICTFLFIFSTGFFSAHIHQPKHQSVHYINKITQSTDSLFFRGIIDEELKGNGFSNRFIIQVESIISENRPVPARGKILLNVLLDSVENSKLQPGTRILSLWKPQEINNSPNPFQFDYKNYLKHLKIERQLRITHKQIQVLDSSRSLRSIAWNFREQIISSLKKHNFKNDEIAVFQALILGQRRDISDELYKNYAAAGAIHILAISGLHIGILLIMLNYLLKPIERVKRGKWLKLLLILILLWSFAFLTGLSASVVRAVCMFSFLAVGMQMRRKTGSLNSVFLSLFFLLLIDPYYLFQVGFQLSYLAVISIIIFQPLIYNLLSTKIKVLDYFWKLTSVSLAAQIGVIPLSLYYFHQFPGLFLVTNLIVLPFLGIILGLGILIIVLSLANILPGILENLFSYMLSSLNSIIENIAGLDTLIFSDINFSSGKMLALYLVIISLVWLTKKPDFPSLSFFLISILLIQTASIYERYSIPNSEAVVFHKTGQSVIGLKKGETLEVLSRNDSLQQVLQDYKRVRRIKNITTKDIPEILDISGQVCLIIDTTASYKLDNFKPEILILQNSPKLNLERLIQDLEPEKIIADGSNYHSYVDRWRRTSENKKIPFHYTGEKGAYIFKN